MNGFLSLRGGLCAAAVTMTLVVSPLRAQTLINGAGATFPAPIYTKWFSDYQTIDSSVRINYQPIGSGGGIRQVTEGTVDFGASDGPMTDDQLKEFESKHKTQILHFPTVLGAAVVTYNVPGINSAINLTSDSVARIFLGKITKWNDESIRKANPGVKLPDQEIVVVHRADASGTTYCFTDFLTKVNPEWAKSVGKNTSVKWPVGLGAKGNEGVTGQIKQTPGAIGYVELTYAVKNKLPYANVQNAAGKYVKAELASVSAAAAGAATAMPEDFRVSITNAPGATSYPIATFTWLLVPSHFDDASKGAAIKKFVKWALTDGQKSVESLDYAPLPKTVQTKELAALAKIK